MITRHSEMAAMKQMASTANITCRFTAFSEVTSRITPTTLPLEVRGWDTARMLSPVSGSLPRKKEVLPWAMASVMSEVPGAVPERRLEVEEIWMRPLLLRNCISMRPLSWKSAADCTAFW